MLLSWIDENSLLFWSTLSWTLEAMTSWDNVACMDDCKLILVAFLLLSTASFLLEAMTEDWPVLEGGLGHRGRGRITPASSVLTGGKPSGWPLFFLFFFFLPFLSFSTLFILFRWLLLKG